MVEHITHVGIFLLSTYVPLFFDEGLCEPKNIKHQIAMMSNSWAKCGI